MVFESENFYVYPVELADVDSVVDVYNSNTQFLENHMDVRQVTFDWVTEELESMKAAGFCSCKVVDKRSRQVVGIIDYAIGEEAYLSLLMIHKDHENMGSGKQVYKAFEAYAKSKECQYIRLDVVTGYSDKVMNFWMANGFEKVGDITLNWTGVTLPAVTMKKEILG